MKATYDILVVPRNYCNSKYVHDLYNFLDSKHQSAKFEYDTKKDADRAYNAFHNAKSRYKIYDVKVTKRDNIVYISRVDADLSVITNYDRVRNMSIEEMATFLFRFNNVIGSVYKEKEFCINWLKSEEWDAN